MRKSVFFTSAFLLAGLTSAASASDYGQPGSGTGTGKAISAIGLGQGPSVSYYSTGSGYKGHGLHFNQAHWIFRGSDTGYDVPRRDAGSLVRYRDEAPAGVRYRASYRPAAMDALGQVGALRIAGTYMPAKPPAQVIRVDGSLQEIADDRALRRLEKFEREQPEIRFYTPRQAYDARFPSVVYLDSR